jgi:hypothetical protein
MPAIEDQRAIRDCRRLSFCYLCGKSFAPNSKATRDHVPPKAVFATEDRRVNPLILPVHDRCNKEQSVGDEVIGQLVSVLHCASGWPRTDKLKIGQVSRGEATPITFLTGPDLRPLIWRMVKGFHAALYGQPLLVAGKANVHMPFPEGKRLSGNRVSFNDVLPQQRVIAEEIKKNRLANRLDRVVCFNGKCVYECVWVSGDRGEPICMFALRLYDWEKLADTRMFPPRGCVGIYSPTSGKPASATRGTALFLPTGGDVLDPFAGSHKGR